MRIRSFIVINSFVKAIGCLIKLGSIVVVVFEVDSVMLLRDLNGFVDLSVALADLAEKVPSVVVFVQTFGLINHAQLNCHHCQLSLQFGFFLGLSDAPSPPGKFHVADTNLGHIKTFALDAHDGHFFPNGRVLNVFDLSLIHI